MGEVPDAEPVQPLPAVPLGVPPGAAAAAGPEGGVAERVEVREEQPVLEDHAQVAAPGVDPDPVPVPHRLPEPDLAVVERHQAGERPHQGGLAGAVRPDDRDHVAGLGTQADVDRVPGPADHDVGVERAHRALPPCSARSNQRSRISASAATETTIRITLSTTAASWSVCSAT